MKPSRTFATGYLASLILATSLQGQAAEQNGAVKSGGHAVRGSTVTLYQAGDDYGVAPTLLATSVSANNGRFTLDYDPPAEDGAILYLVAEGGTANGGKNNGSNPAIKLATILGYHNIPAQVTVNERTTVAAAYTMNQFLDGDAIGGPAPGIPNAADIVRNLVKLANGQIAPVLGQAPNGNETATLRTFNTLADSLAACVRSQDDCGELFALATPPVEVGEPVPPTDTLQAIQNIARYPTQNVQALFDYAAGAQVYAPRLNSAPSAWFLALRYVGNGKELDGPGFIAFDEAGNAWIANNYLWRKGTKDPRGVVCGANDVLAFSPTGEDLPGAPYFGGGANGAGFGIVLDKYGNIWNGNFGFAGTNCVDNEEVLTLSHSVSKYAPDGTALSPDNMPGMPGGFDGNGTIFGPQGMSSDPMNGNLWIANCRNNATMPDGETPGNVITIMNAADETDVKAYQPFTLVTEEQQSTDFLPKAFGMTVDINGVGWVAGNNINQVVGIDENGVEVANFGKHFDQDPPPPGVARRINRPMGLASDSLGGIWVANSGVVDIACGYQIPKGETDIDGEDSTFTSLQNAGILDAQGKATNTYDGELASIAYIRQDDAGTYILDQYTGGGVIVPWGVALDGNDNVWIANFDGQRLSQLCGPRTETCPPGSRQAGAPISPDDGYHFAGLVRVTGLSIDPSGNVWLANNWLQDPVQTNPGGREVVVFLGMAKPVITPLLGYPRTP